MIPEQSLLLDSLLILLLPGFVTYKVRNLFFPKTPASRPDTFDKVATYFLLTLTTYIFVVPALAMFQFSFGNNPYETAIVASITALLLGFLLSLLQILYESAASLKGLREIINDFVSSPGPLWYRVFRIELREEEILRSKKLYNEVALHTKKGDILIGELFAFPVEDNVEDSKDIVIKGVTEFHEDGTFKEYPSEYRFLINQRDIEKIISHYTPIEEKVSPQKAFGTKHSVKTR